MGTRKANGNNWTRLDSQLRTYGPLFRDELKILTPNSDRIATTIACQLQLVESAALTADDPIPAEARLEESRAFQSWMDIVRVSSRHPAVIRAQVITQNYVCFIYLGEALFKALRKGTASGSVTRKCCKFLTDNPVRAFRNALAHANWRYMPDSQGLEFWAKKGSDESEPIVRFEVSRHELAFWQMLARAVAYVAYTEIAERKE